MQIRRLEQVDADYSRLGGVPVGTVFYEVTPFNFSPLHLKHILTYWTAHIAFLFVHIRHFFGLPGLWLIYPIRHQATFQTAHRHFPRLPPLNPWLVACKCHNTQHTASIQQAVYIQALLERVYISVLVCVAVRVSVFSFIYDPKSARLYKYTTYKGVCTCILFLVTLFCICTS